MKSQPIPSDREVLAGLVERVTYQNTENGFCVIRVKARSHRDLVTVVGHAATISAGEWITASGDWVNDRTHGQQFKARFLRTSEPTSEYTPGTRSVHQHNNSFTLIIRADRTLVIQRRESFDGDEDIQTQSVDDRACSYLEESRETKEARGNNRESTEANRRCDAAKGI